MATAAPLSVLLRRQSPSPCELYQLDICFRHPGYHTNNLLLTLPRTDSTAEAGATPGIYHRTALLACQIIAGNAFDNSRFTLDRAGQQPVQVPLDGILADSNYYLVVDGSVLYPIVPSFQDWAFPHDRIPDIWFRAAIPPSSNSTCGITNTRYAIDDAHLVPQKEIVWYGDNDMSRYGKDVPDINNKANILPLRKDIHYCFDNRWFVIVPKNARVETGSTTPSFQFATHIISRNGTELWPTCHNNLVGSLDKSSPAYLLARFAWAILFRVKVFVTAGPSRYVIRIHKDEEGKIEYKAEYCTREVLISKYGGCGSQAATPKKRKSEPGSIADQEENIESSSEDGDISMEERDGLWDMMDDSGRRRRQESSDETIPDTMVHLASDVEADLREALRKGISKQETVASEEEMILRLK